MEPTTTQRRLWGRMGALRLHGAGKTNVGPAHEALKRKWEEMADPDGVLSPEVRAKRAGMLRRAHMIDLSLAAAEARRKRKAGPDRVSGPASEVRRAADEHPTAA
jgi:hypothetical protein